MKLFEFFIYDEPMRQKYFRYGSVLKIVYRNGEEIQGGQREAYQLGKPRIEDDLTNIEKLVIETHYQRKESEIYPNFMQVRWSFQCADERARTTLDSIGINYKTLPIEIVNEKDHSYKAVFFEEIPNLVDLESSNARYTNEGKLVTIGKDYFNTYLSKIVLKSKAYSLKGVFCLKELYQLVCDEETKKKLEQSGLTGFSFKNQLTAGN